MSIIVGLLWYKTGEELKSNFTSQKAIWNKNGFLFMNAVQFLFSLLYICMHMNSIILIIFFILFF
jgi:hypothetical protein